MPGRIAVIDIGSNSIRLVVFDALTRAPIPLFNEKVFAELGKTVADTGRLNPDGIKHAFESLTRFSHLLKAMKVASCHVVATAAVRDAEDGAEFLAEVMRQAGLRVTMISGEEEGRLSAEGVLSGIQNAEGAMGDMGGGSVELVRLKDGKVGSRVTLPFGPFRLMAIPGGRAGQVAAVDAALADLPWLKAIQGESFYVVGGIWRAFAKLHIEQTGHPLHIIHNYVIDAGEAIEFAQLLSKQSRQSLEGSGASRRRLEGLPYAAMFMERLLKAAKPSRLVFSAFGLREGILHDLLPLRVRAEDPLLSACADIAERIGRFGAVQPLLGWIMPLCREEAEVTRLSAAACLLSDLAWLEHPDYRAEQAFLRALRAPFGGIDHSGRAFLAMTLYLRYGGRADDTITAPAYALLNESMRREAIGLGLMLRLAYTLCGGALTLLERTQLVRESDRLTLRIVKEEADLKVEAVEQRLDALGKFLGISTELQVAPTLKIDGAKRS